MSLSGMTREVEKEEEGQRRNGQNTNKEKWKRKKKREVRARDSILEGWRTQKRTAVKAMEKVAESLRSLGLAPVLWSVEPAGVLASASSCLHDPVVQLAGCAVSCRDRSALTPPTLNEPGLAATRQTRQRCPGQGELGRARSACRHQSHFSEDEQRTSTSQCLRSALLHQRRLRYRETR